jgi:tRNA-dihydrouridine synthase B
MFSGRSDWRRIAELKEKLQVPVIGNGDVNSPEDALRMFRETGCDAVMIGRASMKNPWIFSQVSAAMRGLPIREPTTRQRRDLILHHFRLLVAGEDDKTAFHKIRTFAGWYTHGLPGGRALRQRINGIPDSARFLEAVEEFFDDLLAGRPDGHPPEGALLRPEEPRTYSEILGGTYSTLALSRSA